MHGSVSGITLGHKPVRPARRDRAGRGLVERAMRRRLRKLCYGIQGPGRERSAGVHLARVLLFAFNGLWFGAAAFLLVFSLAAGWSDLRWLTLLIVFGVIGVGPAALVQAFVHPAPHRYAMHHRRASGGGR